jgi:hypothetical protein
MANPSQRAVFWALLAAAMIAGAMSSIEHPRQEKTGWEEVRRRRSMEVRMGKERPTFKGERYTDGRRSARAVTGKECTAAMCLSQLTITSPTEVRETHPIPTNRDSIQDKLKESMLALWIALSCVGGGICRAVRWSPLRQRHHHHARHLSRSAVAALLPAFWCCLSRKPERPACVFLTK